MLMLHSPVGRHRASQLPFSLFEASAVLNLGNLALGVQVLAIFYDLQVNQFSADVGDL